MEPLIALIAYYQLHIVIIVGQMANFTNHILQPIIPLLSADVGWSQTQVAFASLGPTQAFGERRAVNIELIVKGKLFILLDIFKRKYANTDFPQHIPLLCDAVWLTGVVDETC